MKNRNEGALVPTRLTSKPLLSVGISSRVSTADVTPKNPLGSDPVRKAHRASRTKKGRIAAALVNGSSVVGLMVSLDVLAAKFREPVLSPEFALSLPLLP